MRDVIYLAITAAFFAACAGYVRLCDRVIGPDAYDEREAERS